MGRAGHRRLSLGHQRAERRAGEFLQIDDAEIG